MSKYTTEVRYICESMSGLEESAGLSDVDEIISTVAPEIFKDCLSAIIESEQVELPKKILRHYYTREIGMETVGLWRLRLNTKMIEIMPYYNKLYESASLLISPLDDTDFTETVDSNRKINKDTVNKTNATGSTVNNGSYTNDNTGTSNTVDNTINKYNDTPQSRLSDVTGSTYLTDVRIIDDTNQNGYTDNLSNTHADKTTSIDTNDFTGNEDTADDLDSTRHVKGKMQGGSKSKLLEEYRKTILNIDMQVINDLADLFMLIY